MGFIMTRYEIFDLKMAGLMVGLEAHNDSRLYLLEK